MKKHKKRFIVILIPLALVVAICITTVFAINGCVKNSVADKILDESEITEKEELDCIIVLGCGVNNGAPSAMLADRLNVGISLYKSGVAPKILMSGDHGREEYDEVNVMKQFAIDNGVPSEDIFMDHAGFSTYESVYRAKEIFEIGKAVIVTQEYHLYRALYLAENFEIEAYGVSADLQKYRGQQMRDFRELLARNKDFINCFLKPKPTFLGEAIPVQNGNGDVTND